MANQSSTGFGLRPLRKVGQNDDNAGLSEWKKASGSAAINHHELVQLLSTGYVLSAAAGGPSLLGSLNGSFYTAPTTLKPTWSNYAPSIVASDHTCLINDDPYQMYEMMTALTNYTDPGNAGSTADITTNATNTISGVTGTGDPFTSGSELQTGCFDFDDNEIRTGNWQGLPRSDFTVAFWYKGSSHSTGGSNSPRFLAGDNNTSIIEMQNNGTPEINFQLETDSGGNSVKTAHGMSTGTWYHLPATAAAL